MTAMGVATPVDGCDDAAKVVANSAPIRGEIGTLFFAPAAFGATESWVSYADAR